MTLFWLSMLQIATLKWQQDTNRTSAKHDDFNNILLKTPSLMDTNLWRRHYSKGLLFSPKARESWQWPDLDPLPASLLESAGTHQTPSLPEAGNDPDRLIRFALILVQTSMRSSVNRGAIIKHALSALERSTIQLRAQKCPVPPYSETQAYFWIQLVHAYLASVDTQTAQNMSPIDFKDRFAIAGAEWSKYYSKKVWDGIEARRVFVTPDLKPLPNVIEASQGERRGDLMGKRVEGQEQFALNEAMAILVASALEHDANNTE
jgi:ubiquitin carboxyl-terminal hydrolase L3